VITDFGVHPYWFSEPTDLYVVASGYTKKELTAIRIDEARIMESGIPIDAKFSQKYDRNQICRKLGLMPDTFTVLVITGSFGIGPIEEIARALGGEAQVLAVCARNEKLYQRLKEKDYPGVRPFGFVDNIHELMAASDVIVTKPGGLSTSELLAMELVPVFICAIAGQETFNIEALASYGIESRADSVSGVRKMVLDYKNNPEKLRSVKDKIRRIGKPRAAGDLCDAVCKGGIGAGS
jgi:processive 1,2-diacylglycerol beta-glucosyltransferase